MGFLSDLFDFENMFTGSFVEDIFDKPSRLITGIDPASTKVWNKVLGRDDEPLVNVFGSPGKKYYEEAAKKGINTKAAGTLHTIADTIAGFYGAQGLAGIGGSGPAGYMGVPKGATSNAVNKALINASMKAGNNVSNGRSVLDGVIQAGLTSGLKSGVNSTGNNMSGFGDLLGNLFSGDSDSGGDTDWLGMLESDLDGGAPYDSDFFDYGNGGNDAFTIGDSFDSTDFLGGLFENIGSTGSSGSGSFIDNLMKQFGSIGDNAKNNPLGALSSALGAYNSFKESTAGSGNSLNAVQQLMLKGDLANDYTAQPVKYGRPVAYDPRRYMQSYDKNGNATNDLANQGAVGDMYKRVLGRNADQGGEQFWSNSMDNGMTGYQVADMLNKSPEKQIQNLYQQELKRLPDFGGMNYFNEGMSKNGMTANDVRTTMRSSPEYLINNLYEQDLGRTPDVEGMDTWTRAIKNGMTPDQLREQIRGSEEYKKRQGALSAIPSYVAAPRTNPNEEN